MLPFLQSLYTHDMPSIIPILFGNNDIGTLEKLSLFLSSLLVDEDVFVIASSDMSHFFSEAIAQRMDKKAIDLVLDGDLNVLYQASQDNVIQYCGIEPVIVTGKLMDIWDVGARSLLKYDHSGSITQDRDSVVGYCSIVYT